MSLENRKKESEEHSTDLTRRKLLNIIGIGAFLSSIGASLFATIRFLYPKVLYEPPTIFKTDRPQDYPKGTINFIPEKRTYIVHDEQGIYAMSAICTHLGCTVGWERNEGEYQCPCHGSKYDQEGTNIAGPAPKPLERYYIKKDKDGRVLVDTGKVVDKDFRMLT